MDAFTQRIADAQKGIFSVDRPGHRWNREQQAHRDWLIELGYIVTGVDPVRVEREITLRCAREMDPACGVWPRSTAMHGSLLRAHQIDTCHTAQNANGGFLYSAAEIRLIEQGVELR